MYYVSGIEKNFVKPHNSNNCQFRKLICQPSNDVKMKWLIIMLLTAPLNFYSVGAVSKSEPHPMDEIDKAIWSALIPDLVKTTVKTDQNKTEPTLKPTMPASSIITTTDSTTTDSSENFTYNPETTKEIDNNEKSGPHTSHSWYFDWPKIQLNETSKFTLIMIAVFCFYIITYWLIHRAFNKLDNPENSFLGSTPLICGSTEQDSPV